MKIYQRVWVAVCAPLAMFGLSVGAAFVPVVVALLASFFAAVAGVATWVWLWRSEDSEEPPRRPGRAIAKNAGVAGGAAGAVTGFEFLLGPGALLLLFLVLGSSPYAVRGIGRWLRSGPTSGQLVTVTRALSYASPEYLVYQPPVGVEALTDEELCQAWRTSYTLLGQQPSAARIAAVAAERQTYLEELERRHPRGFGAWLASGARAAGNPLPYVTRDWAEEPAVNWDELTRGQDW
jgi:hypothetical protein